MKVLSHKYGDMLKKHFRGFLICSCISTLLVFCSCSSDVVPPDINTAADSDIIIHSGDTDYQGHITYVNKNTASLGFSSPGSMSGIVFRRADGQYSVELNELKCKSSAAVYGDKSTVKEIFGLLDFIQDGKMSFKGIDERGLYEFSAKNGNNTLTLFTGENGEIAGISSDNISVEFKTTTK